MLQAKYFPYQLQFKKPSGTSRGILTHKNIWIIKLWDSENPSVYGLGECNPLVDLSIDDRPDFEEKLKYFLRFDFLNSTFHTQHSELLKFPSIRFAIETAKKDLLNGGKRILFDNEFSRGEKGITINGLVWMGDEKSMQEQIEEKINSGYKCIKLKIGAIDFDKELSIIRSIRKKFSSAEIEIRVDANGAFSFKDALSKLEKLALLDIHSIEQPIQQGQEKEMAYLCKNSPLPIALDEELIAHQNIEEKKQLLEYILPQYIILKPSLLGGWTASEEWISIANTNKISWWITSALESNIGLNAIAQWTFNFHPSLPQGLGTGQLYNNNFASPLKISKSQLIHNKEHFEFSIFD
ncbi:MAG: o-succinylbenzoate synthase [Bacteroidetes bacterium]|nr:o-succinylbenzoate synthase [Bacteroidota bacterium]